MSFVGNVGVGAGPAGALRFAQTRGRVPNATSGVNYPSPFFDIAQTYLPPTMKSLLKWCRYYFLTNPLINATCFKLSEYPVTDIVVDHVSENVKKTWTEYLTDHLRYRGFQIEVGLDYHAYGNAFVGISYPFKKYLICGGCNYREQADKIRGSWMFTNFNFRLTCPKCGAIGDAGVKDQYIRNASGIKLIRYNPEDIEVTYNDITGDYTYFYTIPATLRNDVVIGRKDIVEGIPQIFIQALREQKGIIFNKNNIFHMRRPTLATQDRGWGIPLLLPVLKDTYYLQIMKKAQEAILLEHIVPLRILFPQAGSGASDPYTTINLVDWRDHVATEIARWRFDNNYIPILPLPVGNQTIGGDGRALLLTGEIQQWSEQIMVGMGVPREFLLGGMSYAGTNVSMRMLENAFIGYITRHKQLLRFVMKSVSGFMNWPEATCRFKPFKMADDLQRKALLFQYNQAQKISDTTLLGDSDLDASEENAIMLREADGRLEAQKKQQLATATIQGEAQLIMAKYQVRAQQTMMQAQQAPAAPGEAGGPDAAAGGSPGGQEAQGGGQMSMGQPAQQQQPPGFQQTVGSQLNAGQKLDVQPAKNGMQMNNMGVDLNSYAYQQATFLSQVPPMQQKMAIDNLRQQSPELADMVLSMLSGMKQQNEQQSANNSVQVDQRPLPEQRSPRRQTASV